jgi:UDP-N-acetylglucosamine 2-epimerase (non-hydrolysing)
MIKIVHIAGARPNFVKIASILQACQNEPEIKSVLVHTGQHYSHSMSKAFFEELEIPQPDINLEVGSGSHAFQTAETMKRLEPVLLEQNPDAILVVGDVNSTAASVLVAAKLGIRTIHVEAGLRSFDRTMPEEINRIVSDAISDLLFVSEPSGVENLRREGVEEGKIFLVGNVMIDTLERNREKANASDILTRMHLDSAPYALVTLHRPHNVDRTDILQNIVDALAKIQNELKIIFPVHPRTKKCLSENGICQQLEALPNFSLMEPLGYLDFLKLMSHARIVLTDSGGIQEETTILGIPCLTLRENTERPITITQGTNKLVGLKTEDILTGYQQALAVSPSGKRPDLWDGKAAGRIVKVLLEKL